MRCINMKNSRKILLLFLVLGVVFVLSGCNTTHYTQPLDADGGFTWVQWIVRRIADLIYFVSNLAGGYYVIGLLVITVLIRVLGWPIYAKTNNLSANMQIAQPDMEKVKQKYQGKTDQASQRAQQQEMMAVYKEYGINPLGCLLPLLQMPIFIAMYQTVRRIPLTERFDSLNFNFLIFDFKAEPKGSFYDLSEFSHNWPFLFFAIIVGLTMFFYQRYAMTKPDILQNKKYRTAQQEQSEKTMKYMSYFMVFMLVIIAYTNLGIAFYWIIGNLFQFVQTHINRKQMIQRLEERKSRI